MKKSSSNRLMIVFFIVLLIFISCQTFLTDFSLHDETWNFQSIYKIYQGGQMYTNNNVIITPIFFILGNMFFSIFNANLFTFRIYNIFIYILKYILLYRIFRKLGSSKVLSILYVTCWLTLDSTYICCGANYNTLGIVFALFGILFHFSHVENKNYHFIQGFLIFLVFFTKQTLGIYYAFGIVLFELLEIGLKKQFWTNQLAKLSTFLSCLMVACFILFYRGNLFHFIDLCFGGLFEFGSTNHGFYLKNLITFAFMLCIVIFSIYIIKKEDILLKSQKRNIKFLLCFAFAQSFNIFPLANGYHINMSLTFYFLLFVHTIDLILMREIFTSKSHFKALILICLLIFLLSFIKQGYYYFSDIENKEHFSKEHPFYNAPITQENFDKIADMSEYIFQKKAEGTNVLVLSYEAASFMVPLGINNNEFDLLFSGNLGYNSIQKTIHKINHMRHTEFLMFTDEEDCFFQESKEIQQYIKTHFKKTGNFLNYSIYTNE